MRKISIKNTNISDLDTDAAVIAVEEEILAEQQEQLQEEQKVEQQEELQEEKSVSDFWIRLCLFFQHVRSRWSGPMRTIPDKNTDISGLNTDAEAAPVEEEEENNSSSRRTTTRKKIRL